MRLERVATPPSLWKPRAMYATLASTLSEPINAKQSLQTSSASTPGDPRNHPGMEAQENACCPEDNVRLEDTYGSLDAFLEAAASKYPPPTRGHPTRPPCPPCLPHPGREGR